MSSPRYHKTGLSRLGGMVNTSLDHLGLRRKVMECQAVARWAQVVGPHIAASSLAERVHDGVMFVCCKSSTWCNELTFHKADMIKRLNKAVGGKVISDIRFSARGFRRAQEALKEDTGTSAKNLEAIELTEQETAAADAAAAVCASEDLARRVREAVLSSKRLAKLKQSEDR